jgi:hypothetical protein
MPRLHRISLSDNGPTVNILLAGLHFFLRKPAAT